MTRAAVAAFAAAALGLGLDGASPAAEVSVGSGASLDLGTGSLDLGCANLTVAGTLSGGTVGFDGARNVTIDPTGIVNGGSATLEVAGNWDNSGTFTRGTSSVNFVDGCSLSSATIWGDTTFYTLDMTTSSGKLYNFEDGTTQTIEQSLALAGAAGNLLTIRSTVGGSEAYLDLQGSHAADFVDVQDNHATGNAITLGPNSVKGTNTSGWVDAPQPGRIVAWDINGMMTDTPTGSDFIDIKGSNYRSLALREDGSLTTWGSDSQCQVTCTPTTDDFVAIEEGWLNFMALKADGSFAIWGDDSQGQVSDAPTGTGYMDIAALDVCAVVLRTDGSLHSWGHYDCDAGGLYPAPAGNDFVDIECGAWFCVALRNDGSLFSWGSNGYGAVSGTPAGNDFVAIEAAGDVGMARRSNGTIVSWGRDYRDQVGESPTGNDFVDMAIGGAWSLALKTDGSMVSWGYDSMQVQALAGNNFIDIAAGNSHALALIPAPGVPSSGALGLTVLMAALVTSAVLRLKAQR
jgi:hypothetical protein